MAIILAKGNIKEDGEESVRENCKIREARYGGREVHMGKAFGKVRVALILMTQGQVHIVFPIHVSDDRAIRENGRNVEVFEVGLKGSLNGNEDV